MEYGLLRCRNRGLSQPFLVCYQSRFQRPSRARLQLMKEDWGGVSRARHNHAKIILGIYFLMFWASSIVPAKGHFFVA